MVKSDMVRARDCAVYDADGRVYTDFEAGVWCANLGHGHPRIVDVLCRQAETLAHVGNRYTNDLAEKASVAVLSALRWDDGRCVFLSSGSEAVEFGVRAARRATGKPLLLSLSGAYLSAYGSAGEQSKSEWHRLDWSGCESCPSADECDPECDRFREIPFERVGGFVFDSGNMHGTVRFPPDGLVRRIAERVRESGGLLVVNEITTGMGRTGKWFGFEHYGLSPDIVALGKGLGNGYPVSCVALVPPAAEHVESPGFRYVQSHQNDPIACAVATEVIAVIREEELVERSRHVGARFLDRLQSLARAAGAVREARGRGLMIVLELNTDRASAASAYRALLDRGFLVGMNEEFNLIRFYPPLTIGESAIDGLLDALPKALR